MFFQSIKSENANEGGVEANLGYEGKSVHHYDVESWRND